VSIVPDFPANQNVGLGLVEVLITHHRTYRLLYSQRVASSTPRHSGRHQRKVSGDI